MVLQAEKKRGQREESLFFQSLSGTVPLNFWLELQRAAIAFGLRPGFTRADVEAAFRRLAPKMHPDAGGTDEDFQNLLSQRDLLLREAANGRPLRR